MERRADEKGRKRRNNGSAMQDDGECALAQPQLQKAADLAY